MANFYGADVAAIKPKESLVREAIDNAGSHNPVPAVAGCNRLECPPVLGFLVLTWVIS